MSKKVSLLLTFLLVITTAMSAASRRFTLVIDAGHGGHDTGAVGAKSKEKDLNLSVALAFGKYVEENCPDVKVIYTRKTDVFIPLKQRANIANKNNADLFISVHTNALPAGKIARGFETYTLGMHRAKDNLDVAMRENGVISMETGYKQTYEGFDPKSSESYIMFEFIQGRNMEKSVELARFVQTNVCSESGAGRPDKGVHQAGFLVLRETSMPSCLIELGFITTPDEEDILNDGESQDRIALSIFHGFKEYKEKYDNHLSVPYRTSEESKTNVPNLVPSKYKKKSTEKRVEIKTVEMKPTFAIKKDSSKAETKKVDEKKEVVKKSEVKKVEPKVEPKIVVAKKEPVKDTKVQTASNNSVVFKVQILASSQKLAKNDSRFKGETNYDLYQESSMYKYTLGSSSDYNEIYQLRKSLLEKFPEAFIVAFKDGKRTDVSKAIKEFRTNKK